MLRKMALPARVARWHRGLLVIATVSGASLALPSLAGATEIYPGQGIGAVALGQTKSEVRHELGPYSSVVSSLSPWPKSWGWIYRQPLYVSVSFEQKRHQSTATVNEVVIGNPDMRTASGIGIGSTLAELQKAYPAVKCKLDQQVGSAVDNDCFLTATSAHGEVATGFMLSQGTPKPLRIREIFIGYASDFGGLSK